MSLSPFPASSASRARLSSSSQIISTVDPAPGNGLRKRSQIMIDKVMTVRRDRLAEPIGRLGEGTVIAVNRSLALFLGFG